MVVGSFTDEIVSAVAASRLWKASVLDIHTLVPKLMPEIVSSIVIVEGDGGVGTVKKFNFTPAIKDFTYVTDRLDVLDNENYTFKSTVLEGGLIGFRLKSYSFATTFTPTSDGGCKGILTVEYDTLDDTPLSDEEAKTLKDAILGMSKAVEGYLLANPDAYV